MPVSAGSTSSRIWAIPASMDETRARNVVERAYTTHLLVFGATPRWRRRPPSTLLRWLLFRQWAQQLPSPALMPTPADPVSTRGATGGEKTQGAVVCIALRLAVVVAVAVDTTLARVDRRVLAAEPPERDRQRRWLHRSRPSAYPTSVWLPGGAPRDLGNA